MIHIRGYPDHRNSWKEKSNGGISSHYTEIYEKPPGHVYQEKEYVRIHGN